MPCTKVAISSGGLSRDSLMISSSSLVTLSSIWCRMKRVVDQKITPNRTRKLTPVKPAYMSARRKLEVRNVLSGRTKGVSGAAHRMNQRNRIAPVYLVAQAADVSFNDAGMGIEVNVPDIFEQHGACDYLPGVFQEILEQSKFARQEIDGHAATKNIAGQEIDLQICEMQGRFDPGAPGTATQCRDAREQFRERERLYQVVVRAGIQALHPVVNAAERGQKHYGRRVPRLTHCLNHAQAVNVWQHAIDDQQIPGLGYRSIKACAAIGDERGLMPVFLQAAQYVLRCLDVVFDQQDFHRNHYFERWRSW